MPVITLLSDWGLKDHYAGAVKGTILRHNPAIQIIDITHQIEHYDILQASFVLRNTFPDFPEGTVHIVGVNTYESKQQSHVAVLYKGHYFVGADNGIFSLAFDEFPEKVIVIEIPQDTDYFTFSTRDRFVKAACHIASGKPIEELGFPTNKMNERHFFKPVVEPSLIRGRVIYIDGYNNLFINITRKIFENARRQRSFVIQLRQSEYQISKIHSSYSDVDKGDLLALFGSSGFLEIAINQGNARGLLGLRVSEEISIEFEDLIPNAEVSGQTLQI